MRLHSTVIDEFFERPDFVREWAIRQEFKDEVSPADGIMYRGIVHPLPDIFVEEAHAKLSFLLGQFTSKHLDFLRLSVEGYAPPHRIHTDVIQAEFTCIVYLNTPEQCRGGTGIYEHRSGMLRNPATPEQHAVWLRDTNDFDEWVRVGGARMRYNRALVMASDLFHASLPKDGFGTGPADGRLVWVSFFNLKRGE